MDTKFRDQMQEHANSYRAMSLREKQLCTSHFALLAVVYSDFELMADLMENDALAKHDLIDYSIRLVRMNVLEWFLQREGGKLPNNGYWSQACGTAISTSAKTGDVVMLKWLHTHGLELTDYLPVISAEHNHLEALKYLYKHSECLNKLRDWKTDFFVIKVCLHAQHHKNEGDNRIWEFLHQIKVLM